MSLTLKSIILTLMWFFLSTVLLTNAFETYSETDQLAEESVGGYGKQREEEQTTPNSLISFATKETNNNFGDKSGKDVSDVDDDPLQKILPKIKFNCKGKSEGYHADNEFCQVFHFCKTNGFRFTFMCPTDSLYNEKLMACEYNSTQNTCIKNKQIINTQTNSLNTFKDSTIKASAGQANDLLQKSGSQINTSTEKLESVSTTTSTTTIKPIETTKKVDPYLIRRRVNYGLRAKTDGKNETIAKLQNNPYTESATNKPALNESLSEHNVTQTIQPFSGFRRLNRNKSNKNQENNTQTELNQIKTVNNSTKPNSSDYRSRIPSNALPVLHSIRPSSQINSSIQHKFNRNRHNVKSRTTTTTTTPPPSLLTPTSRGMSTTISPFDYFTPVFNSGPQFPLNSDFFPLSMHRKPENKEKDKSTQTVGHDKPFMTQQFFNSIRHSTNRPLAQKETQINSNTNSAPTESVRSQQYRYSFNRSPLYEDSQDSDQLDIQENTSLDSETDTSMKQLIEKLKQLDPTFTQQSDNFEAETSLEPNETFDESAGRQKRKAKPKQFLTVPLLVPTGISKSDLRRKLGSTLLKPTTLPLSDSGERMPAYVLEFDKSQPWNKKKMSHKHRSKRQSFNWNPFASNPLINNNGYLPMSSVPSISSPIYSHHNNYYGFPAPIDSYSNRHTIEIGERPTFRMSQSAPQPIPIYNPPKHQLIPNNFGYNYFKDNNIYDLSEFSDNYYDNTFNRRPVPMTANDMSPYRAVSLRKPGVKRPPRRQRIPNIMKNKNESNFETITTIRPLSSVPVSPRPYSKQIPTAQFYTQNNNPFNDISDESLNEAIKVFDNSDDGLQQIDPDFDSQQLFNFNSGQSFSNDFIPITSKSRSAGETLNGRSSKLSSYPVSQTPVQTVYEPNNYFADDFPPLPQFGNPEYRIPFIDIPDPTLANIGNRNNYKKNLKFNTNTDSDQQKHENKTRYSTPYLPDSTFSSENTNSDHLNGNETERNPNHNYDNKDNEELQTARTDNSKQDLKPLLKSSLKWDNIVGQYHKQNKTSFPKTLPKVNTNKNDTNDRKDSQISTTNQKYITYGTRLNKYSQIPEISVKTSVSYISSLQPEASDHNQVIISKKSGTSALTSDKDIDNTNKTIDELYNQRAFDRLMLFNYYNRINRQKSKSVTTTTTVSPLEHRYPSTSHWSIRGWTGQFYPQSRKSTTTTTTTTTEVPVITAVNSNIEYLDLFESEAKHIESTTQLPQTSETTTVDPPEPPYKKIFNSHMGATHHSNKYSKPNSFTTKTRSDISNYLSSLTL